MADAVATGKRAIRLSWLALILSVGGLAAALLAALGTATGIWGFRIGLLLLVAAFLAAVIGGVVAIVAFVMARRRGVRTGRKNLIALIVAIAFGGYMFGQISAATKVPPIHDITTNLADVPQFTVLPVRADNFDDVPDGGDARLKAMTPQARWAAIHAKAYGDIAPLHLPLDTAAAMKRAIALVQERGWAIAKVDQAAGTIEATATSFFFRFKDDIVIRIRPDTSAVGGATVDMRSISRVGQSDIGVNAKRIRAFLADLKKG